MWKCDPTEVHCQLLPLDWICFVDLTVITQPLPTANRLIEEPSSLPQPLGYFTTPKVLLGPEGFTNSLIFIWHPQTASWTTPSGDSLFFIWALTVSPRVLWGLAASSGRNVASFTSKSPMKKRKKKFGYCHHSEVSEAQILLCWKFAGWISWLCSLKTSHLWVRTCEPLRAFLLFFPPLLFPLWDGERLYD